MLYPCRYSPAFTLLEIMLYMVIQSILLLAVLTVVTQVQKTIIQQKNVRSQILNNRLVLDLIERDIISASCQEHDWQTHKLIFKQETIDQHNRLTLSWISWEPCTLHNKSGIKRIEGLFDPVLHVWRSKKKTDFFDCTIIRLTHALIHDSKTNTIKATKLIYYCKAPMGKLETLNVLVVNLRNHIIQR